MSKSFNIMPTRLYIPTQEEVIKEALSLSESYFHNLNIDQEIKMSSSSFCTESKMRIDTLNERITSSEIIATSFSICNRLEWCNLYYYKINYLDKGIWEDEFRNNPKAMHLSEEINLSLGIGYGWQIVRTAGQGEMINYLYGYLAIAVAKYTDGIIYSDDGAWQKKRFSMYSR